MNLDFINLVLSIINPDQTVMEFNIYQGWCRCVGLCRAVPGAVLGGAGAVQEQCRGDATVMQGANRGGTGV